MVCLIYIYRICVWYIWYDMYGMHGIFEDMYVCMHAGPILQS